MSTPLHAGDMDSGLHTGEETVLIDSLRDKIRDWAGGRWPGHSLGQCPSWMRREMTDYLVRNGADEHTSLDPLWADRVVDGLCRRVNNNQHIYNELKRRGYLP